MLKNFVLETANAPGTSSTFNLGGAASGRLSYSGAGFTNGQLVFYVMDDGSQKEWGIGTFNTGSPNTMTRTTVIGTTTGGTSKLNFTGTTNVYNSLPAENTAYRTSTNALEIGTPGNITANSNVLLRGHLNGLITSRNAGTPNTKIDISVGSAMDEVAHGGFITSAAVLTIDAGTTGANGLDTGALAASTTYHINVIGKTDGTAAGFLSTSLTPTLPSGYSLRRRVGSIRTDGSAHFVAYVQTGDDFDLAVPVLEVNATDGVTTAVTTTLGGVPSGIIVRVALSGVVSDPSTAGSFSYMSALAQTDTAPSGQALTAIASTTGLSFGYSNARIVTNASGQIRRRASSTTLNLIIVTNGWTDTRGKLA